MKIAIISPMILPVPSLKGGAVEGLIESIIRENEIRKKIEIDLISIYDKEAEKKSFDYKNSNFIFLDSNCIVREMDKFLNVLLKKVFRKRAINLDYVWKYYVTLKLRIIFENNDYECVIIENSSYLFNVFNSNKLKNKYRNKVLFHVHNKINKKFFKWQKELCSGVISISDYLHNNIQECIDKKIKIHTVHNGIKVENFAMTLSEDDSNHIYNKYGISKTAFNILFVGRITQEKGIQELLDAFQQLDQDMYNLIIVGCSYFGSGLRTQFEKKISEKIRGNKSVIVTGFIPQDEIGYIYNVSNVAVFPSIWDEPLGLTMIEAQVAGIPLITTNVGGIPETVNKEYSRIIKCDEHIVDSIKKSIVNIKKNINEWDKKAKLAQLYAQRTFSESEYYNNFYNAIISLLEKNK